MGRHRIDDIARAMAATKPSRRRVVHGLLAGSGAGVGALLGLSAVRVGPAPATAAEPRYCQRVYDADAKAIVSKNACGVTTCGGRADCFCVQTVGHTPRCLIGFDPTAGPRDCPATDECNERNPCPSGRFCAKIEECCGQPRKVCLRPCPRA